MGIGVSLLLIAIGAVMRFAVSATTSGFSIHTAGLILMILGGLGLIISLFFAAGLWGDWDNRRRRVVEDPPDRVYRGPG